MVERLAAGAVVACSIQVESKTKARIVMSDEQVQEPAEQVQPEQVAVVEEQIVAVEEPVAVVEEPVAVVEETPEVEPSRRGSSVPSPVRHVVSGSETDDVYLDKCVYKNTFARKSLTVHHVQRRLVELGYRDAGSDKDGWYGDLTMMSIAAFQSARSLAGDGCMNAETFVELFNGDQNVTVHVD